MSPRQWQIYKSKQTIHLWHKPETKGSLECSICGSGLTSEFAIEELVAAMKTLKPGKSPGPDNIHSEFILHLDDSCLKWLAKLFSTCMEHKKLPKFWKMAKMIAVLKPDKPVNSPKSYQPISLLRVTYKLLEKTYLQSYSTYY